MKRVLTIYISVLACCLVQQVLVAAIAQAQQPVTAVDPAAVVVATKPGVADGAWSPALTGVRRPLYRLRSSDTLEIDFTFSPELNQTVTVQPDGYIPLKGAESIYVQDRTVSELREAVRRAYAGVLHDPEVTVVLKDFDRPYFIAAGELGRPGKYELRADLTVSEAVALAGGFTPRAKHSQVVLFRHISQETVESHVLNVKSMLKSRKLSEDVHLRAGDMLFVPQNLLSKIRQFLPASSVSLYASPTQF
jgi:polysaccharide export outer membrane protein